MSNPIPAIAGSRLAAVLKVPLRPPAAPSERGNISYQALKPARSRSTQIGNGPADPAVERSRVRCIRAPARAAVAARERALTSRAGDSEAARVSSAARALGPRPSVFLRAATI